MCTGLEEVEEHKEDESGERNLTMLTYIIQRCIVKYIKL